MTRGYLRNLTDGSAIFQGIENEHAFRGSSTPSAKSRSSLNIPRMSGLPFAAFREVRNHLRFDLHAPTIVKGFDKRLSAS